ncbi:HD-like signal output (HDOD) protein [Salinibacter ruber]|uniref:HDOD domain-containing protein n=1 Tax=Salinibacter ruber TaxID=146919 RepID=UPI0021678DDB|nr:HDOD domain-containing protein [Salinibacter ruber]MCS3830548.1 HD-like signal output (HDOD) protein [Salinibacter ruber]
MLASSAHQLRTPSVQKQGLTLTFPTLPSTISKVEEFIASGQTDPDPLIDIVEHDPSVSLNVLRRVNSPYHGLRREVESIDRAVRLLGFVEVSSIVMIEGVEELREHFDAHSALLRQIAHSAVFTGRFAQGLTKALDVEEDWTRLAFSAGFIHAMGRLVLLHIQPDRYATLAEAGTMPLPDTEAEAHAFGENYRTLAPQAADHWELPERVCSVLQIAANPADEPESPSKMLGVSIRNGGDLARRDLDENFAASLDTPEDSEDSEASKDSSVSRIDDLMMTVAQDASTYASEVGHF